MFKFKINNNTWKIVELSQQEMRKEMEKHNEHPVNYGRYFGLTYSDEQVIFLDKDLCAERKRQTLLHELGHCYIVTFMTHERKKYSEEDVVDIISNSHDILTEIIDKYYS